MGFPNAAYFGIGRDDRARRANEAALEASAELRARREAINLRIEALRLEACALTVEINAAEHAAAQRVN